jgi:copper chaperone CopZ
MKITCVALAGALLLSTVALAKDTTETFKISGWHCEGCAGRTADAVKHLQGVKDATANAEGKTLTVVYDDTLAKSSDIESTIKSLHYKVQK